MNMTVPVAKIDPAPEAVSTPGAFSNRKRFLDACHCRPLNYPPLWLMRQAGRALPEYRELKEVHTFLELVQTPELAAEVTLQPIRRFDFDAAILFSDILAIAEGLGQPYQFQERGGIQMEYLVNTAEDIDRLDVGAVTDRLQYTSKALRLIKSALGEDTALIGFAGSPWTLANFMIEGGGVKEYTRAKSMLYAEPRLFSRLLDKITRAVIAFLNLQIDAGADAVQIFDSLGGILSDGNFFEGSAIWTRQIVEAVKGRVPVIVFSRGVHGNWQDLVDTGANVIGVDWNTRIADVSSRFPAQVGVQGNLDPFLLTTTPEIVAVETRRILLEMRGRPGHIFNLGHGVPPAARLECIESLVATVRGAL
jgi:uroporphyrinogen decarboxylase